MNRRGQSDDRLRRAVRQAASQAFGRTRAGHARGDTAPGRRMTRKQQAPGSPSRVALANWPLSIRLTALLVLASLTGLVFGGLRVADAVGAASAYARSTQLAVLGGQVTAFAQAIEDERDLAVGVTALTALKKAA